MPLPIGSSRMIEMIELLQLRLQVRRTASSFSPFSRGIERNELG